MRRSSSGGDQRLEIFDLAFERVRPGVAARTTAAPHVVVDREAPGELGGERRVL
ncbi:MAG TPA: hypothetical protein VEX15_14695 [Nocardioidaceae bacterium]|nr:hypothetical protein [Nocardioidaceae bacterium]